MLIFLFLATLAIPGLCSEFTQTVFGRADVDGVPAAFGDFNSDELTDIFMLTNNFRTIQVMYGAETEPLLHEGPKCTFNKYPITGIIPGDFDGDAYMDILFTVRPSNIASESDHLAVYINWGDGATINCTAEDAQPLMEIKGEPMALDYDDNMIIDLFALDKEGRRTYYVFGKDRQPPAPVQVSDEFRDKKCRIPHSHAFLDFNGDFTADLVLTGEKSFEIWNGVEDQTEFKYHDEIKYPSEVTHIGQSLFLDVEQKNQLNLVLPVCQQDNCVGSSSILVFTDTFRNLHINLKDPENKMWGFVSPKASSVDRFGRDTITLRGGDFNMDGYPDLIATLINSDGDYQTVLLENVPCTGPSCQNPALSRTFAVQWNALLPTGKKTIMGAFYDFFQDGILDVIMVQMDDTNQFKTVAHRNALDYDSNFVKVIVLTGLSNSLTPPPPKLSPMGRRKKTYGTNLPGPRVAYYTTNQDGFQQNGTSAQIPQSAYFALQLPYSVFGLGRTPNFVDTLQVGMCNRSREWKQLIPNSQMIVVPRPLKQPSQWKAQLFVTPSKLIVMSTIALGGTCFVIMLIILVLHVKEKREDKLEKLQEAHRFHFDAM